MRSSFLFGLAAAATCVSASLDTSNKAATNTAAKTLAGNLMSYYDPADNGVLPSPYNWWESAGFLTTMIHYFHATGDATYNAHINAGIVAQSASSHDFMGPSTGGNDDQLWWGLAAITAAELNFQAPASGPSWLQLAETVFTQVQSRWDTQNCGGGLGWQISRSASGYNYKNSISNGLFFQLAARLGRSTGNSKYTSWASKSFDWVKSVGLVDNSTYAVYDGTDATKGCTSLDHDEWSYNVGVYLYGAAVMLDTTNDAATWQPHLDGFIGAAQSMFSSNNVLQESKCEPSGSCTTDQLSFKAYLTRWLAQTAALVPASSGKIQPMLSASVAGAVGSCNGGANQDTCGTRWPGNKYDGTQGVGQQMAALEAVQGLLAGDKAGPAKARRSIARGFKG